MSKTITLSDDDYALLMKLLDEKIDALNNFRSILGSNMNGAFAAVAHETDGSIMELAYLSHFLSDEFIQEDDSNSDAARFRSQRNEKAQKLEAAVHALRLISEVNITIGVDASLIYCHNLAKRTLEELGYPVKENKDV